MKQRGEPEIPPMFDYWDRLIVPALGEAEVKREKLCRALDHEWKVGRSKRPHGARKRWNINTQRIAEIGYIIRSRHDGPCDTDDAELYLQIALPHFIKLYPIASDLRVAVDAWTATFLPTLTRSRAVEMTEEAEAREWRFANPDESAKLLNVGLTERSNLGLRTIGAIDCTKVQRKANRKKRDAEYQARKRVKAGATPRSASNVAQAKALGISLSTLKRRLKAGLVPARQKSPDPISSALVRRTHLTTIKSVHPSIQPTQGPARTARPRRSVCADGPSPSAKPRAVPTGHAVPLPLPIDGVSEHPDLIDGLGDWRQVGAPLVAYEGGVLPRELARAVREALRVRMMTQEALANQVGVSRPQIGNVLRGRFGLSRSAASNLMQWLTA